MMKVQDLIDQLGNCDPEAEVMIAYNFGDHWDTKVAVGIDRVDEELVVRSERLRRWTVPDVTAEFPSDDEETKDVVVLH